MRQGGVFISGHAIVSADDRIGERNGDMPQGLRIEADWRRFQDELDRAALVVVGRIGHQAFPNVRNRRRLVLSGSATGLEQRADAWWWNPAQASWPQVASTLLQEGGCVAVTGGRLVFDLFLTIGFDAFHLARATRCAIPDGAPIFSACSEGRSAADVLRASGLREPETIMLDAAQGATLQVWSRAADHKGGSPPRIAP